MFNAQNRYDNSIAGKDRDKSNEQCRAELLSTLDAEGLGKEDLSELLSRAKAVPAENRKERYEMICALLIVFAHEYEDIYDIGWETPAPETRHGVASANVGRINYMTSVSLNIFKQLTALSDTMFIASGVRGVTLSFSIENIF